MQLVLTATQDAEIEVIATDRKGNPTTVQDPSFTSSDAATLLVGPSQADPANPLRARVSAVGPIGAALVTFTGDADLGDGVVPVIGTMDVVVNPGQATVIEIQAGPPVEQPEAAPKR